MDPSSLNHSSSAAWILSRTLLASVILKIVVNKYVSLQRAFKVISEYPGRHLLWLDPLYPLAIVLAPVFPLPGSVGHIQGKFSLYRQFGSTAFTSVKFSNSQPYFWFADVDAVKAITSDRVTFRKDTVSYEPLNFYGKNIISAEMSEWKRHRAVAAPAFSEANNALVWAETLRIITDWFNQLDATQSTENSASNNAFSDLAIEVVSPMVQATLLITSAAGFGRRVSWDDDSAAPASGYTLTLRSAVISAVENVFFRMLTPDWFSAISSIVKVPFLSARVQATQQAFGELGRHMLELVSLARASVVDGRSSASSAALLHNLVEANMSPEGGSKCLSDGELLSNMFSFLLAGHETSAHSLGFAISLLALHPEAQSKMYAEVRKVWPEGSGPVGSTSSYKQDFIQLPYTLAFFRETLRLFPAAVWLTKLVHADVVLPAQHFTVGEKGILTPSKPFSVVVPVGSVVIVDIWGLHMNPLYWGDDVEDFKPERFIDSDTYRWPRDAFLSFSAGPRACIGQRFAYTESVCILASLVNRYEVLLPENLIHKPFEEQKEEMLKWTHSMTLTPTNANVRLRRRT